MQTCFFFVKYYFFLPNGNINITTNKSPSLLQRPPRAQSENPTLYWGLPIYQRRGGFAGTAIQTRTK